MLKEIKKGIVIALSFVITLGLVGISYATWVDLTDVSSTDILTADLFNKVLENQRVLDSRGDWGFKDGPLHFVSNYTNGWSNSGDNDGSIDCDTNPNGCIILESGVYDIKCAQRSNGNGDGYILLGLNGSRSGLESNNSNMWSHEHDINNRSWIQAAFFGSLNANDLITCGPHSSYSSNLGFTSEGYTGYMKIIRVK